MENKLIFQNLTIKELNDIVIGIEKVIQMKSREIELLDNNNYNYNTTYNNITNNINKYGKLLKNVITLIEEKILNIEWEK